MNRLSSRQLDAPPLQTARNVGAVAYILIRWTCAALTRRLHAVSPR